MTNIQMAAIAAIEAQQKGRKRDAVWMVGEQLKDICRREEHSAQLIAEDLKSEGMSLAAAEKKIAARAKANKVGSCGCVTPFEADEILREFYGLPGAPASSGVTAAPIREVPGLAPAPRNIIDLTDFL